MMELILKSYFDMLVSIGAACSVVFLMGVFLIFRSANKTPITEAALPLPEKIREEDVINIAGEDVVSTQLDLARAFIETNQTQSAKQILFYVQKNGNAFQKDEANQLLGLI